MRDELDQVRDARPEPERPSPRLVQSERNRLMAHIRNHEQSLPPVEQQSRRRQRWTVPLVVVAALVTAAAGWAVASREGNLDTPPFSGKTWQLTVGEGSNGDGSYKVCHSFQRTDQAPTDGNGLGTAGCETSRSDVGADSAITDVVPAVDTPTGLVIFVDLTTRPVATVRVVPDEGPVLEVASFRMPQSGEQFAAVEISGTPISVAVEAVDRHGTVIESRTIRDLTAPTTTFD